MTSSADAYTFDFSTSLKNHQPVFTSKQWAYQIDQNNSAYQSKQVIFDLSGFYNSQRFINPQEMFIVMPVVSTLSSLPAFGGPALDADDGLGCWPVLNYTNGVDTTAGSNLGAMTDQFAYGFKSGYWNLIHSIQIQVDGKDIIQLTPYINYLASFEAITSWSQSDIQKYGAIEGFLPDAAGSWMINQNGALSAYGIGVCNNSLPPSNSKPLYPYSQLSAFPNSTNISTLNQNYTSACATYTGSTVNDAFYERMKTTNRFIMDGVNSAYDPSALVNQSGAVFKPEFGQQGVSSFASTQYALDNYMISELISAPAASIDISACPDADSRYAFRQTFTSCIIKFKSFCNLFEKLPLTRGLYMRIIMNVNTGYLLAPTWGTLEDPIVVPPAGPVTTNSFPQYGPISTSTFQNTCPIMLAPIQASGLVDIAGTPNTKGQYPGSAGICVYPGVARDVGSKSSRGLAISVSIYQPDPIHKQIAPSLAIQSHALQNCRVYAPIIDMEPELVSRYISEYKEQAVYYRDALWFATQGIAGGSTFNTQIGNGFVNLQRLIIMPFYHDDSPAGTYAFQGQAAISYPKCPFEPTSPWSSAPATVAPMSDLVDFNVLISNMNIFQRNISYSFENFLEEMGLTNAINGGLDTGLTSGLIDYYQWQNNYRYYVVDLSRRLAGDNTPKSLTVIGKNASAIRVDYFFFLQYRRHLTIDIETGHITVSSN